VRELIRQEKKDLGDRQAVARLRHRHPLPRGLREEGRAGIVAMEGNFGLAPWYRKAVEKKQIVLEEHACATLTAGLRAAAFGVPFQPVGGVHGSDLPAINKWASITTPTDPGRTSGSSPPSSPTSP
jgi:glutaconate CoA-transferase subunit A